MAQLCTVEEWWYFISFLIIYYFFQWKEADDGQIMDSKLKCMFKMPDSGDSAGVTAAVANGAEKTSNEIPSSVPTKPSSPKVKPNIFKESLQYRLFRIRISHCFLNYPKIVRQIYVVLFSFWTQIVPTQERETNFVQFSDICSQTVGCFLG